MHLYCALSKMATFQRRCCACMPFFMYYCCLCTSSITVSDTGQYQAVILLYEEHELARLRVSVADSTVPLVCAPTFPGSHHVSSSLWLCKFSSATMVLCLSCWKSFSLLLSSRGLLRLLLLWLPCFFNAVFLPSVSQAQQVHIVSVYIGNTIGKLELLSQVELMMPWVRIFSFWKVSWSDAVLSIAVLSIAPLLWDLKQSVNMSGC